MRSAARMAAAVSAYKCVDRPYQGHKGHATKSSYFSDLTGTPSLDTVGPQAQTLTCPPDFSTT